MKKALNLACPYNVYIDAEAKVYSFFTQNQIEYNIAFVDSCYLFEGSSLYSRLSKIYNLIIENTNGKPATLDVGVQQTIQIIVQHFFEDKQRSIIYLCNNSDNRALSRHRKFSSWYKQSPFKNQIIKIDEVLELETDTIFYISLLFHREHPHHHYLYLAFKEVIEELKK